ncbi:disks large homolog 1-like [Hyperolius riggenbachi]|uniref:disks large homolog 1-like n=1 Tax=Hyperolius riggenbachi TaxID=752182 RepID=UPI0035A3BEFE
MQNGRTMSTRKDTERALHLLCSCQAKLCAPEQQKLKDSLQEVMCMFRSDLFQALLDIRECYEVMLHNGNTGVTKCLDSDPLDVDQKKCLDSVIGDQIAHKVVPQCVCVTVKMTEQKETVHTMLNLVRTTLPKVAVSGVSVTEVDVSQAEFAASSEDSDIREIKSESVPKFKFRIEDTEALIAAINYSFGVE